MATKQSIKTAVDLICGYMLATVGPSIRTELEEIVTNAANEKEPVVLPLITLNSTSANMLFHDYSEAQNRIFEAINAMEKIEFHARDYAQQENGAAIWKQAREQFNRRLQMLHEIRAEQQAILEHLVDLRK